MSEVEQLLRRFKPVKAPEHLGRPIPRDAVPPLEHSRSSRWIPTLAAAMALLAILFYLVKSVLPTSPAAPTASPFDSGRQKVGEPRGDGVLRGQDEHPEWKHWSSCKIGSRAKYTLEEDSEGEKSKGTVTRELLEIGTDKLTLKMTITGPDDNPKTKSWTETIPKERQVRSLKELGEEEIDVHGKKLKCRVVNAQGYFGESIVKDPPIKIWISREVPGGVVRVESKSEDPKRESKLTLLEYEKK